MKAKSIIAAATVWMLATSAHAAPPADPTMGPVPHYFSDVPPPRILKRIHPLTGEAETAPTQLLVIPVKFADTLEYPLTEAYIKDLFFGMDEDGQGPYPYPSTARYYDEMSFHSGVIVGDVLWPPMELPQDKEFYSRLVTDGAGNFNQSGCNGFQSNGGFIPSQTGTQYIAKLAVNYAFDQGIDLNKYDWDNDGTIDGITVFHSSTGAEQTSVPVEAGGQGPCILGDNEVPSTGGTDLWSHVVRGVSMNVGGDLLKVSYGTFAAQFFDPTQGMTCPAGIGIQTHEIGHLFGLLDWYDFTEEDDGHLPRGVGSYSLMGYGLYDSQNDADSDFCADVRPKGLDPQARIELNTYRGWTVYLTSVTENTAEFELDPSRTGGAILKIPVGDAEEYFLIEYRSQSGFDAELPGDGVLIWHVDPGIGSNNAYCVPTDDPDDLCRIVHPRLALEQADGLYDLEYGRNLGDRRDYYNPEDGTDEFSADTVPWSKAYDIEAGVPPVIKFTKSGLGKRYVRTIVDPSTVCVPGALFNVPPLHATVGKPYRWEPGLDTECPVEWSISLKFNGEELDEMTIAPIEGGLPMAHVEWKPTRIGIYDVEMKVTNIGGEFVRPWQVIVENPADDPAPGCSCSIAARNRPIGLSDALPVMLVAIGFVWMRRRKS